MSQPRAETSAATVATEASSVCSASSFGGLRLSYLVEPLQRQRLHDTDSVGNVVDDASSVAVRIFFFLSKLLLLLPSFLPAFLSAFLSAFLLVPYLLLTYLLTYLRRSPSRLDNCCTVKRPLTMMMMKLKASENSSQIQERCR